MKILTIGNFTQGWDGSICDEEHIAQSLISFGHEVTRCQRESLGMTTFSINKPYDFVLIAQWDGFTEEQLDYIIEKPLIYWAFDYQADGQEWHERLVKKADLYLSKRIADSKYPNWQWLSQDFAPGFLHPFDNPSSSLPPTKKTIDVLFTGTYLPWATERNETLKAVDNSFMLQIHSVNPEEWEKAGFRNVGGPVMDDALPQLIAKARVNISIDHTFERGYWSDRNAQIMCCGGYVLFKYVPLSETVFGPGIDYFYDTEDCLKKIQNASEDESYREFVAGVGYQLATYLNRLRVDGRVQDLLTIVGAVL